MWGPDYSQRLGTGRDASLRCGGFRFEYGLGEKGK